MTRQGGETRGGRLRRRCSSALTPTLSLAGEGEDPAPPPSPGAGGHSFLCRWLCNCLLWGRASPGNPCNPRWAAAPPLLFRPHPNPLPRGRGGRPRAASLSRSWRAFFHGGRLRRRCFRPHPNPGYGGHSFLCRWLCNCLLWGRASPGNPCNPRWAAAPPLLFRPHPNPLPRGRGGRPHAASLSRSGRAFFPLPLVMQLSPLGTG